MVRLVRVNQMALGINEEITSQVELLREVETEVEYTSGRMGSGACQCDVFCECVWVRR